MTAPTGDADRAPQRRGPAAWRARRPSMATRFAGSMAAVLVVLLVLVVSVVYYLVQQDLERQLDLGLTQTTTQVKLDINAGRPIQSGECRFLAAPSCVQIVSASGAVTPNGPDGVIPVSAEDRQIATGRGGVANRDIRLDGLPFRVLTTPLEHGGAVQVGVRADYLDRTLYRLKIIVAIAGGLAALVAGGLAYGMGWRGLRPVGRLTRTAERITATGDLQERIAMARFARGDELTRLAVAFNAMLDRLSASITAQRQLVADASHELRTPLTSLRTNVEILHRGALLTDAQRDRAVNAMVGQLSDVSDLVGDLVELARGEQPGGLSEEVRLDEVVTHCVGRARFHWPGITFRADIDAVVVTGVAARLARLVANLLDNAAKFSPAEAIVEVSCRPTREDGAVLSVRDHGLGIPTADLPHVFNRFYRSRDSRNLPGSGLGLAIVAQVASSHGARIDLTTPEDGGTRIAITFLAH